MSTADNKQPVGGHANDEPEAPTPDILEVEAATFGPLSYTTRLVFQRSQAHVGGPLLSEQALDIQVEARDGELVIVMTDRAPFHDLVKDTPAGRLLIDLRNKCYLEWHKAQWGVGHRTILHTAELTADLSLEFFKAIALMLLNYSNTPLPKFRHNS